MRRKRRDRAAWTPGWPGVGVAAWGLLLQHEVLAAVPRKHPAASLELPQLGVPDKALQ